MKPTILGTRHRFAFSRPILATLIMVGGLLAGWSAQGGLSTAFYINASNYRAPDNGSGSVTLTVTRQAVSGSTSDWNLGASASVTIYLTASGTYPIVAADVPPAWQGGSYTVTIPAWYYSTTSPWPGYGA